MPWYRTSFDGVDVERRKTWPPNVLEEGTFERYLLGRLGCESHVPVSILDDAKLTSVIAACETIGMLLSRPRTKMSPKTANPGDANVGFGVLSQGPGRVAERLRDWAMSQLTPTQREGSVQDIFTWAYARSTSKGSYELGPYLLSAFHNAVFLQRRNVKGTVTNEDVEGRRIGIESVAKKLGVSSKFLRKVTEDLGMLEEYSTRRRALRSSQVPAIKDYLDGLIPWRTFREITGLPQEAGTYLVRIGMVVGYVGAKRGVKSVWFRRDQVEGLLTKLRSLPQNTNWRHGFAFRAVVNAHRELPGPLVAKILRGERNVVSLDPKGHFRSVIVECPDKVNSKRAREIGVGDMLLNDAANAIGISRRTTSHLYKIGLLKRIVDTDQLGFRRSDVEAFAEKYITRAAIGRVFGKPSGTIRNMVEAAGVKPILAHNRKGVYDTLYLRRDIEKAFERPFPHHHQDEAVQNLWSLVVQRARDVFPNASLPMRFLSTECWIDTPANEHTAHVVLVADLRVLRFTVAPLRSGAVHYFSIDEQHTPADFDVVFGAMRVRYTQLMHASVESQKRNAAKRKAQISDGHYHLRLDLERFK